MTGLFLFHNGRRGDVLLCRAVYRAAIDAGLSVTIGTCRGDGELFADLAGPDCRIVESEFRNTMHGSVLDLAVLAPPSAIAIEPWLGGNETTPNYQWPDIAEAFERALREHGIAVAITGERGEVPMLDFAGDIVLPPLRRPSVWIDNERTANDACWFVFDVDRLARALPDHDLLCTAPPPTPAANVVDVSHLSWSARSRLSDRCVALAGATMEPFAVTLTEGNRWKPKALCGYDARVHAPFWDYPGNPTEVLATMDELVDFLVANVAMDGDSPGLTTLAPTSSSAGSEPVRRSQDR